jgi:deoxyuridine 5'-triphosphate nucleotidohydrolase
MRLRVKRLTDTSKLPTKAHTGDLGYDLYANHTVHIYPGETGLVKTGIAVQFPEGWGGLIKDRSSVATKRNLFTVAGVIDNGYIGEIEVAFHNAGENIQAFVVGDKIAQMVLIETTDFVIEQVDEIFSNDERGDNGFGSTGS